MFGEEIRKAFGADCCKEKVNKEAGVEEVSDGGSFLIIAVSFVGSVRGPKFKNAVFRPAST